MFIQTEQTPNPSTLKFLPGRVVMEKGTLDFADAETPRIRRWPSRLFAVEGVERVFFGSDFVTVTKAADKDWQILKPSILGGIMEHYTSGEPVVAAEASAAGDAGGRGRRDRRPDQGPARDARASGGGPGRRRYRLPGFPRRRGLPAHAGLLLGLPELDGHAEDGHRESCSSTTCRKWWKCRRPSRPSRSQAYSVGIE